MAEGCEESESQPSNRKADNAPTMLGTVLPCEAAITAASLGTTSTAGGGIVIKREPSTNTSPFVDASVHHLSGSISDTVSLTATGTSSPGDTPPRPTTTTPTQILAISPNGCRPTTPALQQQQRTPTPITGTRIVSTTAGAATACSSSSSSTSSSSSNSSMTSSTSSSSSTASSSTTAAVAPNSNANKSPCSIAGSPYSTSAVASSVRGGISPTSPPLSSAASGAAPGTPSVLEASNGSCGSTSVNGIGAAGGVLATAQATTTTAAMAMTATATSPTATRQHQRTPSPIAETATLLPHVALNIKTESVSGNI
ncbi:uncharacterized protein LOC128868292 [Anastrepha ludens]|uniref:uncharacterized protein LOC128868292 n=1 Tax=Anastrepha ludens TaxID=28586 RepID=UPI0023AE7FF1|nr:uncharacterized protein LOC128868292 [Anastrepha ludens]